jgi:hypothetical protein
MTKIGFLLLDESRGKHNKKWLLGPKEGYTEHVSDAHRYDASGALALLREYTGLRVLREVDQEELEYRSEVGD